jgi:glutamyl-tRNA reductase
MALLSTCSRTELYASGRVPAATIAHLLAEDRGIQPEALIPQLTILDGIEAVGHLFRVAAGLDSLVVGEEEIQGQVRGAHRLATEAGTTGAVLDAAFRAAIAVGRRVRSETAFGGSRRSLGRSAAELGLSRLAGLDSSTVLVIGAGKIAKAVVERLRGEPINLVITSRTPERAAGLATCKDEVLPIAELMSGLARADLVICATSAPHLVVSAMDVRRAMAARPQARGMTLLDLSMPRDVEASSAGVAGVQLLDLEDLASHGIREAGRLASSVSSADAIVDEELARFATWLSARACRELANSRQMKEAI